MASFANDFSAMTGKLVRCKKKLHTFHVTMVHELRPPLTATTGRLQGMLDSVFDANPGQLVMVMKQLRHLNHLTDELHLLSLSDAENLVLENKPFRLDESFRERTTWTMPQADAYRFTIRFHHFQTCPFKDDTFHMGRILTILMENALRRGRDGGRPNVTLHYANGQYYPEFRDDGPGVSSQLLPEIFNRFSRGEQPRAHHSGGSDLGLSIVRVICQARGGSISVLLPETGGLAVTLLLPWTSSETENSRS